MSSRKHASDETVLAEQVQAPTPRESRAVVQVGHGRSVEEIGNSTFPPEGSGGSRTSEGQIPVPFAASGGSNSALPGHDGHRAGEENGTVDFFSSSPVPPGWRSSEGRFAEDGRCQCETYVKFEEGQSPR